MDLSQYDYVALADHDDVWAEFKMANAILKIDEGNADCYSSSVYSVAYSFGGYFIEKWSKHKWELQAGVRYDNKSINTTRLKFNADTINYDFNFSTLFSRDSVLC